ncbi:78428653-39a6-4ad9-ae52-e431f60302ff [Thermothielavioides terrestris]|nr:78428653-39a6-4ad9-ae52-e431f60302ff [Thermothielavioides terrestris]
MSTGVLKRSASLKPGEQCSTGVAHLTGCTTTDIISRTGVSATHRWESISFDPDDQPLARTGPTTSGIRSRGSESVTANPWQRIRDAVGDIMPALKDPSRWADCPYVALDNTDPRLNARSGTNGKNETGGY